MAYSHGIFPLVYRSLKEFQQLIPDDIFIRMKQHYMDIVKQNMLMTSELIKVLKILEENNIEAISFKGPVLSQLAGPFIILCQLGKIKNTKGHKDENRNRCRAIC